MSNRYRYRQPTNEDEFEEFCLILLREVWNRPKLERYGHRGESQYGVDIIDQSGQEPLIAVQCKHHAVDKTLPPSELKEEVKKALNFPDAIGEYYVLTTAKKGTDVQDEVRRINRDHVAKGLFAVAVLTWDEIERLVDQSPSARQCLGLDPTDGTVKAVQLAVAPLMGLTRISISVAEAAHGDLDEIKSCLDRGKPIDADVLAARLRSRAWSDLSNGQRWRLCTFAADAKLRLRLNVEAGQLLLEALTHAPLEEHAVINAIHALRMQGNVGKAKEKANEAILTFPNSAAAHAECIELAPSTEDARARIEATPDALRDTGDVLAAIASRHDLEELSEEAARRGVEKYPDELRSWHVLGSWLLENELYKISPVEVGTTVAVEHERLLEATGAFAKVIDLAQRAGHEGALVDALSRRSAAYGALNDWDSAAKDVERALEIAPTAVQVLLNAARAAEARDDIAATVSYLRRASAAASSLEIRFYLGIALWNQNGQNDRAEALELLDQVAREESPFREPSLEMAIEGYLLQQKLTSALNLLEHAAPTIDPVALFAHRARLAKVADDVSEAQRFASEAIAKLSDQTKRVTRRLLAKNLMYLERFQDALPILQGLAVPGVESEAGRRLVDCAMRIERHDVVLDYCARTRVAEIYDDFLLERELALLDRYDPSGAISVLQSVLSRKPSRHTARVQLALLAIRENRAELVQQQIAGLPKVEEVDAFEGSAVVHILREVGKNEEAAEFGYDLMRRFFRDPRAHRAFRDSLLFHRDNVVLELESVVPGAAVELKESGHAEGRWYVLEDSTVEALGVDNEERVDSPLAKRLLGKRRGEEVALSDGPGLTRTAVVTSIVPKRVYRIRDVWDQWQFRFPDHQEVWLQHIETVDGEMNFKPLLDMFEEHHRHHEEMLRLYRANAMPLFVLAQALHTNELDVLWQIAHLSGTPLRCCQGTEEEFNQAYASFTAASEVVIDLTSLATLMMLSCCEQLLALGKQLVVSHSVMLALRNLKSNSKFPFGFAQTLGKDWNEAQIFNFTAQQSDVRDAFFDRIIEFVQRNCVVLGVPQVAQLVPEYRKELETACGSAGVDSVVLASQPNRILWTDDRVVAFVSDYRLKTPRIWTQLVFRWMLDQGSLGAQKFAAISAKLIGCGYTFTQAALDIMFECGRLANWNCNAWPLNQAIAYLRLPEVRPADASQLGVVLVTAAYRELVIPEDRRNTLVAVVTALSSRADIRKRELDQIRRWLQQGFGINVVAEIDAVATFDAWRAGRGLWR